MTTINLEKYRGDNLPEGKGPKLIDSYIKKLWRQWFRYHGLSVPIDIPNWMIVEKRALLKSKRFVKKAQAFIEKKQKDI